MDKERIKLIIQNMELLVRALKEEIRDTPVTSYIKPKYDDYDEVFEE